MKRLHVHLKTDDLASSIDFYSALLSAAPTKRELDYAKWELDDPCVNIAVSTRRDAGIDHLGVSFDNKDDLDIAARAMTSAGASPVEEPEATCCYAKSNKYWVEDPQGAMWELFHTYDSADTYRELSAPRIDG